MTNFHSATAKLLSTSLNKASRNLKQPKNLNTRITAKIQSLSSFAAVAIEDQELDAFPLPSDRAKDNILGQGWLSATTVRQSTIPGAGYGRFSDVDVPKNTIVMAKPIVPMVEVSSILNIADDEVILFKDEDDIDKFVSLYEEEGQQTREDVIDCLAHFIWTLSSIDGVTLNFTTWSMNHGFPGQGENIRFFAKDGLILGETVADVRTGDELLNDYRDFDPMDEFWVQYCKDEGVKDVVTNLRQFLDL